ncbi:MAG: DUF3291 domain-containing protein, partial [Pseudomonadota bacterium]
RYLPEDPRMADFMNRLDEINGLAEQSPGFVWRLQSDSGNATDIQIDENPHLLVNMSVWANVESLFEYVYKTMHRNVMIRRREWFEKPVALYQALWWIPKDHRPTPEEGLAKIQYLQDNGPSPGAFTFKSTFPPPGSDHDSGDLSPEPYCSGWD